MRSDNPHPHEVNGENGFKIFKIVVFIEWNYLQEVHAIGIRRSQHTFL